MSTKVMTRRTGDRILIQTPSGEEIDVRVGQMDGNRVSLAVRADRSVAVTAFEVQEARR